MPISFQRKIYVIISHKRKKPKIQERKRALQGDKTPCGHTVATGGFSNDII